MYTSYIPIIKRGHMAWFESLNKTEDNNCFDKCYITYLCYSDDNDLSILGAGSSYYNSYNFNKK